jgi:hypothetical protein
MHSHRRTPIADAGTQLIERRAMSRLREEQEAQRADR